MLLLVGWLVGTRCDKSKHKVSNDRKRHDLMVISMVWVKNKAERTKTGRHKLEEGRRKVRKFRSGGKRTLRCKFRIRFRQSANARHCLGVRWRPMAAQPRCKGMSPMWVPTRCVIHGSTPAVRGRTIGQGAVIRGLTKAKSTAMRRWTWIDASPRNVECESTCCRERESANWCTTTREPEWVRMWLGARHHHKLTQCRIIGHLRRHIPWKSSPGCIRTSQRRHHKQQTNHAPWPIHLPSYPTLEESFLRPIQRMQHRPGRCSSRCCASQREASYGCLSHLYRPSSHMSTHREQASE